MTSTLAARRTLRLYPWYVAGLAFHAWMPVFFLYFSTRVSLAEVLALEAIYYASVVVTEVPSGYVSDRFGRKPTLVVAASCLVAAHVLFGLGASFGAFAVGQILLAVALAFNSGTDTSLHLAALESLDQAHTYGEREAAIGSLTYRVGAVAAVLGGAGAMWDFRVAYVLSAAAALVALGAALRFAPVEAARPLAPDSLLESLRRCLSTAGTPRLRWFFGAAVVATVLNHLPYELYQPYLDQLESAPWDSTATPLVAGLHLALVQAIASPVARGSARLARRVGTRHLLVASMLFQLTLVASMAASASLWVVGLLALRSIPRALQDAPLRAAVTPFVPAELRATYLSLQSLVGRLGLSLLLVSLAAAASDVRQVAALAALVAALLVAPLIVGGRPQT